MEKYIIWKPLTLKNVLIQLGNKSYLHEMNNIYLF